MLELWERLSGSVKTWGRHALFFALLVAAMGAVGAYLLKGQRITQPEHHPAALLASEDFQQVGWYGDRTLSKYRQLARDQLGPSCPTGIGAPDRDLLAAVTQDWMDEFERVQLLLRLSSRLRQLHGD